ncbi:saccharopine dehydrogenase family protein [Idiomarina aminovorans]|uniref:saccharopine dehydrogenase family protein n=1 Tax=Idiomarina aminovorans TaxID=2914829 RepID=UPI002005CF22|nr:saccharopine dehydrogenase NADP-binding domain-containing protein [Idiomarina sp. ATCH4]MCK7458365.1 saccharopine dehydrogenase NADP-binding domain-containing protein [Idiomarina sp. ATCH4]
MALRWLIYGAYGYSGKLIAHQAKKRGYQPILAGRNEDSLEPAAHHLGFQYKAFSLDSIDEVKQQLEDVDLVVNCAGPFSQTAVPLINACIDTQTHYLDITGEIDVFEYAHSMDKAAREAGVVICPGVGFDVIPTDCIAARLNAQMPEATHLALGFDSGSRMSRGTAKTSIESLARGGAARIQGQITDVPHAWHSRWIDFGNGEKCAMTIPWGDVSTAYYTTEIPNIEVYIPASPRLVKKMRRMNWFRWVFNWKWVQRKLKQKLESQPAGPEEKERKDNPTYVWGEVTDAKGNKKSMRVKVKNGYSLTAEGAVELAVHTLKQKQSGGFYTPSRLYGAKLLDQFTIQ